MSDGETPDIRAARAQPHERVNNLPLALLWMAGALLSFSMIAIAGREASRGVDTMQLMFHRSVVALPIIVLAAVLTGHSRTTFTLSRLPMQGLRSSIHFIAQYSWFHALGLITLAELISIEFTAPIWVALTAPLFLGEKLTLTRLTAGALGFIGVLLIAQPGTTSFSFGTALGLIAAFGFAGVMIVTKMLTRTETVLSVLFHMAWMQLVISAILIGFKPVIPDMTTALWIAGVAITGLMAHYSMTQAFFYADAMNVAPMDFLRLPLLITVGGTVYGEALTQWVLVGSIVVVIANIINMFGERFWRSRN